MKTEKLSLAHKELLVERFKKIRCSLSEHSFPNLYLFRETHGHQVIVDGSDVFVSGNTYDGFRYVMPTTDIRSGNIESLIAVARGHDFIFPVPVEWLPALGNHGAAAVFSEDDSDYVFTLEKLATYKGRKLHGQKNLLNQFLSVFTPEALPLTQERMGDAREILETWQADVGGDKGATDYSPCLEALELYDTLVLCGGIYYIDKEPAGFVIGEEITPEMFALHFAKGKRKFKGLYQYMYNHFAKILPRSYAYLNFEQDLGKLALRTAKSSYDPDRILRKYRVRVAELGSGQGS